MMSLPCPACRKEEYDSDSFSGRTLHTGDPGTPYTELNPVEDKAGLLRCVRGHTYKIWLEPAYKFSLRGKKEWIM